MSDDKKNITAYVDRETAERLQNDPSVNVSGLVNNLLKEYMSGSSSELAMLEFRADQLRTEVQNAKAQYESKREEFGRVRAQIHELKQQQRTDRKELLTEAFEEFDNISRDYLTVDNKHVKRHANTLDMAPADLLEAYHEH